MPYAVSSSVSDLGDNEYLVTIDETGASSGDEATVTSAILPRKFRVLRQTCILVSGAGATVDPKLGRTPNATARDVLVENADAAATVDTVPLAPVPCYNTDGSMRLFHRSNVNAGSNNVIATEYLLRKGWVG